MAGVGACIVCDGRNRILLPSGWHNLELEPFRMTRVRASGQQDGKSCCRSLNVARL